MGKLFWVVLAVFGFASAGFLGAQVMRMASVREEDHSVLVEKGRELFERRCSSCHAVDTVRRAPAALAVSARYRMFFRERDEFVDAVVDWVKNPSPSKARFCSCVLRRFGVMPALDLPEDELEAIAHWLWEIGEGMPEGAGRCGGILKGFGGC